MAMNRPPVRMAPQHVSRGIGVAGYRGEYGIDYVIEDPRTGAILPAEPAPDPTSAQPGPDNGLVRRKLAERARKLGLDGSGTVAELQAAIDAAERQLARAARRTRSQ